MEQIEPQKSELKPKKKEWKRVTFKFHGGKAWCYRKMVEFGTGFGIESRPMNYYCYNCKNELFFKWKDSRNYYDAEPFKFHKLLEKVLEKKDDDWKTERETHSYYAFCCKCAKKDENEGTVKESKWTKKWLGFDIEKCDCADFVEKKKQEANEAISSYDSKIQETNELLKELEAIKEKIKPNYADVKNSFKGRRLNDFIKQLEQRRSDYISGKSKEEDYLLTYKEWEIKLNQQLEYKNHELTN